MATMTETVSNVGKLVRNAIGSTLSSIHAGEEKITSKSSEAGAAQVIRVSSDVFLNDQPIPENYTPQGENISPPLSWSGVPAGAQELILIVEDPDAPFANPFVHWIMHRIDPSLTAFPAALPTESSLTALGGAVQGMNDAKTRGWFGPKPPTGHGVHHYHFQLFAIDTQLNLSPDATLNDLKKAMTGHVIGVGELIGTFERTMSTK